MLSVQLFLKAFSNDCIVLPSNIQSYKRTESMSNPDIESRSASEKEVANHECPSSGKSVSPEPSTNNRKPPGPPPNGGLTAWLQVLGCFMLYFNTW